MTVKFFLIEFKGKATDINSAIIMLQGAKLLLFLCAHRLNIGQEVYIWLLFEPCESIV